MIDTDAHIKIGEYAYRIGKIQGSIYSYKMKHISLEKAFEQIDEIVNEEVKNEFRNYI